MKKYHYFSENPINSLSSRRALPLLAVFALSIIVLCPIILSAQTNASRNWVGSYYFTDSAQAPKRRKFTDVAPSVSYDITVGERVGNKLVATFAADGVQLAEAYECSVKTTANKIEFYYQNLAISDTENFRKFKKGDLLFSLVKAQTGDVTRYLFQPAAYKITRVSPNKQKAQVYFDKP